MHGELDDEEMRHLVDVFDRAAAGLAVGDAAATQLVRVNQALCDLLGRTEEEIVGHDLREFTHPDDLVLTDAERRSGMRESYEKRYLRPDGSIVWALVGGELVADADGNPSHVVGSIVDITARKQAEEELARIVSQQDAVLALGRLALEGRPLDELFAMALRLVGHHLDVDRTAVLELLPGGTELLLRAGSGWMSAVVGQLRLPIGSSLGGYAILTGQAVTSKAKRDGALPQNVFHRMAHPEVGSERHGGQQLGQPHTRPSCIHPPSSRDAPYLPASRQWVAATSRWRAHRSSAPRVRWTLDVAAGPVRKYIFTPTIVPLSAGDALGIAAPDDQKLYAPPRTASPEGRRPGRPKRRPVPAGLSGRARSRTRARHTRAAQGQGVRANTRS